MPTPELRTNEAGDVADVADVAADDLLGVIYAEDKAKTSEEEEEEASEPEAADPPASRGRSAKKMGEMRTRMLMEDAEEDAPKRAKVFNELFEDEDDDDDDEYENPAKIMKSTKKTGGVSADRRGKMFDDDDDDDEYEEAAKTKTSTKKTGGGASASRRGRPSKRPRSRKIVAEEGEDEGANSDTEKPSKRPRGRPRKKVVAGEEDDEGGNTGFPRRPRGHPRKIVGSQKRRIEAEEEEVGNTELGISKCEVKLERLHDLTLFNPQFQQQHLQQPQQQPQQQRGQREHVPSFIGQLRQMHNSDDIGDVNDEAVYVKKEPAFYDPFQDPIYMANAIKYEDSDAAMRDAVKNAVADHRQLGGREEEEEWLEEVGDEQEEEEEDEEEMNESEDNDLGDVVGNDKRDECSDCGLMVRSAYLARHKRMSCRARDNIGPRFKPKQKINCKFCGKTMSHDSYTRHKKYVCSGLNNGDGDGEMVGDKEMVGDGEIVGDGETKGDGEMDGDEEINVNKDKPLNHRNVKRSDKVDCKHCGKIISRSSYGRHKKYSCPANKAGDGDGDGEINGDGEMKSEGEMMSGDEKMNGDEDEIRGQVKSLCNKRDKRKEKVKCTACYKIMSLDSYTRHKKIFCPAKESSKTTTTTTANLECPDCGKNFNRTSYHQHRRFCFPKRGAEEPRVAPERVNCPNCGIRVRKDSISKHKRLYCPNRARGSKNSSSDNTLDASNEDRIEPSNDSSSLNNGHGEVALKSSNDSSNSLNADADDFVNVSNGPSNSSSAPPKKSSDSDDMVIKCQMCPFNVPYEFSTHCLKILKQHHTTHAPDYLSKAIPKVCNLCNFVAQSTLQLHLHTSKEHMNGQKHFQCTQCSFSTNYQKTLENHEISHTKDRALAELQCDQCEYRTTWRNALEAHKMTHNEEKSFKCSYCDFATKTLVCLKTHTRYKHEVTERLFACDVPGCGYRSKNKAGLVAHRATHRTDKPFKCSDCNFESNRKKQLRVHQKDICPGNPNSFKNLQKSPGQQFSQQQQHQQKKQQPSPMKAIGFRLPKEGNDGELPLPISLDS